MRIKYEGSFTPAELARELAALVDELGRAGVDEIKGLNLYFQPQKGDAPVAFRDPGGREVDFISYGRRVIYGSSTRETRLRSAGGARG